MKNEHWKSVAFTFSLFICPKNFKHGGQVDKA